MAQTTTTGKLLLRVLYASIAMAILVIALFAIPAQKPNKLVGFLGGEEIVVTVADTPTLRAWGLSGREKLDMNE